MPVKLPTFNLTVETVSFLVETFWKTLNDFLKPGMSIDDIIEKYSPRVDEIIEKNQKEGVTFNAGKFKILAVGKKSFTIGFELYFQDKNKKWSKIATTSPELDIEAWLSDEAIEQLQNQKEIICDVAPPETEK